MLGGASVPVSRELAQPLSRLRFARKICKAQLMPRGPGPHLWGSRDPGVAARRGRVRGGRESRVRSGRVPCAFGRWGSTLALPGVQAYVVVASRRAECRAWYAEVGTVGRDDEAQHLAVEGGRAVSATCLLMISIIFRISASVGGPFVPGGSWGSSSCRPIFHIEFSITAGLWTAMNLPGVSPTCLTLCQAMDGMETMSPAPTLNLLGA